MIKKVGSRPSFLYLGIFVGFVAVILLIIWFFFTNNTPKTSQQHDSFAKCLADKGVKMYGAYWCPHCQSQKKEFGSSWKYINYTECSLPNAAGQTQICKDAGIQSYPTWVFADNQRLEGEVSFQDLSSKSGCPFALN